MGVNQINVGDRYPARLDYANKRFRFPRFRFPRFRSGQAGQAGQVARGESQ